MKHKVIISIVALAVIGAGVYHFLYGFKPEPPSDASVNLGQIKPPEQMQDTNPTTQDEVPDTATTLPTPGAVRFSDETDIQPAPTGVPKRVVIEYDGKQFDPPSVTIVAGDTVVFRNKAKTFFQPASNPFPSNSDYPGFDAGKNIEPGGTYEFTFTKVGRWSYHDDLSSSNGGIVIVTQ